MATSPICSVDGCDKGGRIIKGLCWTHYQRQRSHGNPHTVLVAKDAFKEVEAALASSTDECVFWTRSKRSNGYGTINYAGKYWTTSRLVCVLAHGAPPSRSHEAAHSCGNGHLSCINPKHLRWATPAENTEDKMVHGTVARGAMFPTTVLTEGQVREAKRRLGNGDSVLNIAAAMQIRPSLIYDIRAGRSWAWL